MMHPSKVHLQHLIFSPAKLLACALALTLLVACSGGGETPEAAVDSAAEQPTPEELAAAEAKRREEWNAQQQKVQSVVRSLNREELIAESSIKGPQDADVVLLKFSDFQCPFCARASADMKDFTEKNPDVLYVYKQLPLESIHPEAMPAAKAAWAAGQQDQFWIYHDGLFAYQDKLGEDYYVELAEQIGLDIEQFNRDRTSPEAAAAIEKDIQLARDLDLRGTPTFVMNELLIPGGAPLEFFEEAAKRANAGTLTE
ncbi:MAG: thioredoxin domain-containing protein [Cyanobacteria bacterium P01_D01_bin.105]